MSWQKIGCILLAFAILFTVVFGLGVKQRLDVGYLLQMVNALQLNPCPQFFGGYSFEGGFKEGAQAFVAMCEFPLAFLWWLGQQCTTIVTYLSGNAEYYDGAHAGGGVNGGGFGSDSIPSGGASSGGGFGGGSVVESDDDVKWWQFWKWFNKE